MKRFLSLLLICQLLLVLAGCNLTFVNTQDNIETYTLQDQLKGSILSMSELKIINIACDYLKAHGETVNFKETHMTLHYGLDEPDILPVIHGDYIEYEIEYLEVRLYKNPDNHDDSCDECFVVYLSVQGEVLGYNKLDKEL